MAELVTQMNSVVADKTNLESRVSVLLRVLQMRDEQIEQLRSGQKVSLGCSVILALQRFEMRSQGICHGQQQAISSFQLKMHQRIIFGNPRAKSGVDIAAVNCCGKTHESRCVHAFA